MKMSEYSTEKEDHQFKELEDISDLERNFKMKENIINKFKGGTNGSKEL